ncbi:MAG: thioredoxin family protein [Bacteroidetes bacterium B1(2017)]|nr:MAG: thioredoxin family protein [Bacteroidetes bacterium B1(2017)]
MLNIGDKLPDFNLKGFDGKMYTHFDYADKYALAVIFTCNSSPVSQAYSQRLLKLFEKYEEDSMGIVGINSNDPAQSPLDDFTHMQQAAAKFNLEEMHFLYLQDDTQEVAKKFGATTNPEVFLFNRKRELAYKGAIDDCWENEAMVTSVYLEEAIEETLDGMDIDYPETKVEGTPIIWKK